MSHPLPELTVSRNRRALVTADGRPFFYLADTAWELFHRLTLEEARIYLEDRAAKGFNVIQAVVLAEIDGLRVPNRYGHCPFRNENPAEPVEAYWEHVDRVIDLANELGLYIGLLPTWGDKWNRKWGLGPVVFTPDNAFAYGQWIAGRYCGRHIIWILGGDRPIETPEQLAMVNELGHGIRSVDRTHLMTFHPAGGSSSSRNFEQSSWLDFQMIQSGHQHGAQALKFMRQDWSLVHTSPFVNGEPCYEAHPNAFKGGYQGWTDAADVRRDFFYAFCGGAAGYTYGAHPIWQCYDPELFAPVNQPRISWRQALQLPGAGQLAGNLKLLMSLSTELRVPADDFVQEHESPMLPAAACRDAAGRWAVVYLPMGQRVQVMANIVGNPSAEISFVNPRDGQLVQTCRLPGQLRWDIIPPAVFDGGRDMVAIVK